MLFSLWGRLLPKYFPKIFGPNEDRPLNQSITAKQFKELTQAINAEQSANSRPLFSLEEGTLDSVINATVFLIDIEIYYVGVNAV